METLQSNLLPSTNRQKVDRVTAIFSLPLSPLASRSLRVADALAPNREPLAVRATASSAFRLSVSDPVPGLSGGTHACPGRLLRPPWNIRFPFCE